MFHGAANPKYQCGARRLIVMPEQWAAAIMPPQLELTAIE
jgi:hypothetical protein